MGCVNDIVFKKFKKANRQQQDEMIRTLRREIIKLKELLDSMEKELGISETK